ncbi:MAG: SusC/RagA family TonB-linked outer membrane protein [Dysgonamonadaceae bacterium]|jgi:TonB-linked SusC/RagA family outer membrane protein|nr:SusC/RagA family TonB-linked outer membrane protein [Dysgonamonadaceae bacterium]
MKYIVKNILWIMIVVGFLTPATAQTVAVDSLDSEMLLAPVAYGKQSAWKITGAQSSIKGDLLSTGFTSNIANTLYGRLPGLTVQQKSGEPGLDSPTLNIRGVSTFSSGKGIFIVIDGIPSTETFFEQLTPQEIEDIVILKDASATVLYGQRAANGVLLVTTKRGMESPMKVSVSAQYGYQQLTRLPDFLDSYNYATLYNEALKNEGQPALFNPEAYRGAPSIINPNVDWYKEVLRDFAPYSNYNLSAKGGNKTVKYFVLFNATDNRGQYKRTAGMSDFTKNQGYTRFNFRTNLDIQLSKRLSMNATVGGTVEDKMNPGEDNNTDEVFKRMALIAPNAFPVYASANRPGGNGLYSNPLADISERGFSSYNGRLGQAIVKLNGDLGMITPGLSISGAIGLNTYFKSFTKKTRNYARYLPFLQRQDDGSSSEAFQVYGENTALNPNDGKGYQWRNYVIQGFLNYDRTFGSHGISLMLLSVFDDSTEGNNYNDQATNSPFPYRNMTFGGRLTYDFAKRYILEASLSYAGNDRFAPGKKFGYFPAGSLGWIVSNEEFLKSNSILTFLKLRGSYGLSGNYNIGGSRWTWNQYYYGNGYNLGTDNSGTGGLTPGALATPDATWEKQKQANVAIEAGLFNRLNISFDYFKQNRYDILAQPLSTTPDFLGKSLPFMNIGKVENKGFEAVIEYASDAKKNFVWFAQASAWFARNKILFNAEEPQMYDYLYQSGRQIDQPFLLEYVGFFNSSEEAGISNDANNNAIPRQIFEDVMAGDLRFKDQNGDHIIDQNDRKTFGYTSMPEYTLGLRAGFSYRGFDLEAQFQAALNRSVYWKGSYYEAFNNNGKISSIALGRWTEENKSNATYPRLSTGNSQNNYQSSTFWQKNGNFLKMRNIELGYTLPNHIAGKLKMEKLRFFLHGVNLFSLDYMEGRQDPEAYLDGIGYSLPRSFSIGLNIQL